MAKYLVFSKLEADFQGVHRHKHQIFGHPNARWNFKEISSFRDSHRLLWFVGLYGVKPKPLCSDIYYYHEAL
jgi:hypothetical protein